VPRKRSPARLIVALSVAGALAVFLLYTALAGGTLKALKPSQLTANAGKVELSGVVLGPVTGDSHTAAGLRFWIRDRAGRARVPVVYTGSRPDLFRAGREVFLHGELRDGVFVGERDSLVTKCPSKYAPAK
jgi:cytochrome c-type biogenesis protein CcmE